MKTIGLIGGTSWVSTIDYYRLINEITSARLGGSNSARILLYSVNFAEFYPSDKPEFWQKVGNDFTDIAQRLEKAGADCLLFCANTPHLVANVVQAGIKIPLIHIAEETSKEVAKKNLKKVGLLGTKFTMERDFFKERLLKRGIETVIPEPSVREFIHYSILEEMTKDIFKPETKERYLGIIETLKKDGAEGIIFGCTEIPLLLKNEDCGTAVFDTTLIHATAAVDFALG